MLLRELGFSCSKKHSGRPWDLECRSLRPNGFRVTLAKSLSGPQFPHLENGICNKCLLPHYLPVLCSSDEIMYWTVQPSICIWYYYDSWVHLTSKWQIQDETLVSCFTGPLYRCLPLPKQKACVKNGLFPCHPFSWQHLASCLIWVHVSRSQRLWLLCLLHPVLNTISDGPCPGKCPIIGACLCTYCTCLSFSFPLVWGNKGNETKFSSHCL